MKRWIVMDLDGTLCDCSHRVHWAQAKQWDEFNAGIPDDKLNEDAEFFMRVATQNTNVEVLVVTGRDEKWRNLTELWLNDKGVAWMVNTLLMRPSDNHESDFLVKLQLVDGFFGGRAQALNEVLLVLDDRDKVVEAFRDAGFRCWQVQAGSY